VATPSISDVGADRQAVSNGCVSVDDAVARRPLPAVYVGVFDTAEGALAAAKRVSVFATGRYSECVALNKGLGPRYAVRIGGFPVGKGEARALHEQLRREGFATQLAGK
jgi:hypothetical protein